jgi:hypothetical protein
MKYSVLVPLTAATLLAACNPRGEQLYSRKILPAANKPGAAGSVEGAYAAPAETSNIQMAPIDVKNANILVGSEASSLMTFKCLNNVLEGLAYFNEPMIRLEIKSQVLGRQNTTEPTPGEHSEVPEKFVNFNCKPGVPREASKSERKKGVATDKTPAPAASPAPVSTPATTASKSPATAPPASSVLPKNVKRVSLQRKFFDRVLAYMPKEDKESKEPNKTVLLDIECADRTLLDTADKILLPTRTDVSSPDLVIGTGSRLLLMTKMKTATSPAEFVLVTCTEEVPADKK